VYNEILVATDGSDASGAAVDQAVAVADNFESTLHCCHVVDIGTQMSASAEGTIATALTDSLDKVATEALDDAESRADEAGVPTERVALEGVPHEAIVDYCSDHAVDLVVMGSHGRSNLKRQVLGSVASTLVRSVDVPVLIVRRDS